MTTPTLKIYPSAPLEKNKLNQKLEENLNDVNIFKNSIKNVVFERLLNSKTKTIIKRRDINNLKC